VTLLDDPTAKDFKGTPLIGGYSVDDEGVTGQKVTLVENGMLKNLLMSRRPGPDFEDSNGHGRTAFNDPKPTMSNLFFTSTETVSKDQLKKKFLDECRDEKLNYCIVIRQMDNPSISLMHQEDFTELLASFGGNAATDRLPLVVYRVYPSDGHEELVRGARITGFSPRSLRNIAGIGNDDYVYNLMLNETVGVVGTALGAFGNAQNGLPASVVAPSLLFEEVEVRGARGEPKRLPLLPEPPMTALRAN
jgi:TldD protein